MAEQSGQAARSTSGSTQGRASPRDRRQNVGPQQQLSQIEKSVTHLLVATKQLLETLTQWSRGLATENEVSDVYVRLGYEFNIACRAFSAIGVETSDLGPVPDLLRTILEETLSQEASQANLERFLPRIRDIIINLLHGLKRKQQRLRQKNSQDSITPRTTETRQGSYASNTSVGIDDSESRQSARTVPGPYHDGASIPPRTTSVQSGRISPTKISAYAHEGVAPSASLTTQRPGDSPYSNPNISIPSAVIQSVPSIFPSTATQHIAPSDPEPNFPPSQKQLPAGREPKQQDALAALQRGGELERRASRRFSAYQIQKHLGTTSSGIPMMPKSQHSPIPDRGGPPVDSANGIRAQGVMRHNRDRSNGSRAMTDGSPGRPSRLREQVSEDLESPAVSIEPPREPSPEASPMLKTPEDKIRSSYITTKDADKRVSSMDFVKSIGAPSFALPVHTELTNTSVPEDPFVPALNSPNREQIAKGENSNHFGAPPPTTKEPLVLFLQYKTKVKKCVLTDGLEELSIARLQLAFIEKFAWNTHSNGVDLPEIYLQDSNSGVRYELEDLSDVKNNSVLVLNVDAVDEVKRHVDDSMEGLRHLVETVRTAIDDQHVTLRLVSEAQQEAVREVARISSAPVTQQSAQQPTDTKTQPLPGGVSGQVTEVQSLRRELAVLRQTYSTHVAGMEASMTSLRAKAATVKASAVQVSIPSFKGESGRGYVNTSKKTLNEDSEKIITRVDDLQDIVEDLRKDVVTRGVRPRPQQLETVSKDISTATADLKKLQEFLRREKPIWTKVGENELKAVCDDQDMLRMQEELAADLEDDLEKAAQTFALVEQATKQQNLTNAPGSASRSTSRTLNAVNPDLDPRQAKDGVLGEVRALQPNHETRLEAIERAERARQLEMESRGEGAFKKELGSFVEAGRLKKSGGVEEAERLRKSKDDRARKENWDRVNGSGASDPAPVAESQATSVISPALLEGELTPQAMPLIAPQPATSVKVEAEATTRSDMTAQQTDGHMATAIPTPALIPAPAVGILPTEHMPTAHMPGAFTDDEDTHSQPPILDRSNSTIGSVSSVVFGPEERPAGWEVESAGHSS